MIQTVLDDEERGTRRKRGREGKSDEEEEATRRKERRGKRSNEEEGATRRVNNEEVEKKNKKWLEDASMTS